MTSAGMQLMTTAMTMTTTVATMLLTSLSWSSESNSVGSPQSHKGPNCFEKGCCLNCGINNGSHQSSTSPMGSPQSHGAPTPNHKNNNGGYPSKLAIWQSLIAARQSLIDMNQI